jgi:hypothetical protein
MKYCSNCQSINVKQMSSFHTRLLLSIYLFLNFYFFTGVNGALITLIPFIIPYSHKCSDCNTTFLGLPRIKLNNFWVGNKPDIYLLAMSPSILIITLLILNFPNTGLGRIVYLPNIYFLNSVVVLLYLFKFRKRNGTSKFITWVLLLIVTVILSVCFYPQEYGVGILKKIFT